MTQPNLQDRRRDYTVREISRVAMRLFAERGFDAVTIEDIAAEVGMSPRTFFRYFVSKDEVVLRLRRRLLARLLTLFQANAVDAPPVTALRDAYVAISVVPPEEHDEFVRIGRFLMDSPTLLVRSRGDWVAEIDDLVTALAERLGVDVEEDPIAETIVAAMNGAASAAFHRWICTGGRGNHSEAVRQLSTMSSRVLAASTCPRRAPNDPRV